MQNRVLHFDHAGRLLFVSTNLVVDAGREYLMDMVIGNKPQATLSYFSIGNGGADPSNPLLPVAPQASDTDLYSLISLGPDYPGGGYRKPLQDVTKVDPHTVLCELVIDENDGPSELFSYNEAGLYLYDGSNFILYARTTFPTTWKYKTRVLHWYVYF